jgi:hypothetical protein
MTLFLFVCVAQAEEEEQFLANHDADQLPHRPQEENPSTKAEEEAELSDHSDSWEVITRTPPPTPPTTEKETTEQEDQQQRSPSPTAHAAEQDKAEEEKQPTEAAAVATPTPPTPPTPQNDEYGGNNNKNNNNSEEEEEEFLYTSMPEEIHSDSADTYRTDDLFRQGEIEGVFEETVQETATSSSPPQKCLSSTLTEDDDFLKLAAAILHHRSTATGVQEDFDNAEELVLKKYVVEPVTATTSALVGAAHAVIHTTGHCIGAVKRNFAERLCLFAAKIRAYVTNLQPKVHRIASNMFSTVHQMSTSLYIKVGPGVHMLSIPLNSAQVLAIDVPQAVRHVACTAAIRTRKCADDMCTLKNLDWVKIGLAVATVGCAGLLWKANAQNARLTSKLQQREGELAELIARIVSLQRIITPLRVPILRNTTAYSFSSTVVGWPLLVQAI